jgi:hypothetical protein
MLQLRDDMFTGRLRQPVVMLAERWVMRPQNATD